MKKTLLYLGFAALSLVATAQDCSDASSGFIDNYTSSTSPSGVFYWGIDGTGSFTATRNTTSEELDIVVTHGSNSIWAPMGVDINFAATENDPAEYIDVTANQTATVSITNNESAGIEVYFSLISGGNSANLVTASKDGGTVTLFGGVIAGNSSKDFTFDLSKAVLRRYQANAAACTADGGTEIIGTNCLYPTSFDVSEISGIEWSINGEANAGTSWQNSALDGHSVSFSSLKLGTCTPTVGIFNAAKEASFEVFPNPVNGDVVSFSKNLNNITVMNALGSVVFEAASAESLNVSSFENGMYILKSDEGSTKLIIE